ncbi:hypothetical protein SARC_09294 [Sphaeroforma arctica JP610]|uniref:Uncharacterized protein n=1 Tax=Sphaeroforma arctica JP610 TaxID=667725 RepID=A0A0L0FP44_9EUKA|nr:hypothetical protein SARC_09294 [Sphaeroforma arctica JP610]KNC78266.1 hypothetical protein SARC_09294 [Sphaeroforma arctica JP610]|eukprot:XP_014152168.1 hypothetical protein SARC_09294 [Sphaeroforma arctica JP610]
MHRLPMTAEDSGYESLALTDKDDRDDSFDNSSTELFEDHLPQTPCIPLDDTVSAGSSLDAILVTGGYAPPATMARSRTLSGSTNWVRNSPQPTNAETLTVELSSHS